MNRDTYTKKEALELIAQGEGVYIKTALGFEYVDDSDYLQDYGDVTFYSRDYSNDRWVD